MDPGGSSKTGDQGQGKNLSAKQTSNLWLSTFSEDLRRQGKGPLKVLSVNRDLSKYDRGNIHGDRVKQVLNSNPWEFASPSEPLSCLEEP